MALLCFIATSLSAQENLRVETLADGLEHPWGIAFLPDGRALVTERPGRLRLIAPDGSISAPLAGVPPVFAQRQGGLFEAVPHPDFAENGWLYLSYAHGTARQNATRLARAKLRGDRLTDLEVLFTATPMKDTPVHFGGRIQFLPDGTLLLTTGEGFAYMEQAQALDNHFGKVVRLNADGSVPADNPFVGQDGALPEIYTYGHRNPQGIVYDAERGIVYIHEHGPRGGDEINVLEAGANYGWPIATYGIDYSGAQITPYEDYPGTRQPLLHWTPSIAPSGMTLYRGDMFPDWQGDLLVGALVKRHLRRVDLDSDGAVSGQDKYLTERGERIRDVVTAPDGTLLILTDTPDGRVLRLSQP